MTIRNESKWQIVLKWIYLSLMGVLLLSYPYMMVTYTHFVPYHVPIWIWLLRCSSIIPVVLLGKPWKDKGFRILFVYLLWIVLRTIFGKAGDLFSNQFSESFLTGVWVFTACYGMARVLTAKELKAFLRISAAIWTLLMTVSCCVGILAAWQGHRIYTWGDAAFWGLYPVRLMMPYLPTTSGALVSFSALIALCAFVCEGRKAIRTFYVIAVLPMLLALSLTDSRTSFISFGVGIAVITFFCIIRFIRRRASDEERKTAGLKVGLISIAMSLVVSGVVILVLMYVEEGFFTLKARGGLLISNALAETTERNTVGRGFSGGSAALTGRMELWIGTIRYLWHNPLVLLIGEGKADPMRGITGYLGYSMGHVHNMPLMILVETGIPGMLMIVSFIRYIYKRMKENRIIHISLFPIILSQVILSLFIGDLADCFTWLATSNLPFTAFVFTVAGILSVCADRE